MVAAIQAAQSTSSAQVNHQEYLLRRTHSSGQIEHWLLFQDPCQGRKR